MKRCVNCGKENLTGFQYCSVKCCEEYEDDIHNGFESGGDDF